MVVLQAQMEPRELLEQQEQTEPQVRLVFLEQTEPRELQDRLVQLEFLD